MDVIRFGLGVRALRRNRGWTQNELAAKARVSRTAVWRIERGHADRVAVHVVSIAAALGGRIDVRLLWQGEGLDHCSMPVTRTSSSAPLSTPARERLEVKTEVSVQRSRRARLIDILAFHPG